MDFDSPSAPYLSDEFLASARELFRQAEAAADNDAVRARVRKARIGIDYTALIRSKKFTVEGDSYRPTDLAGLKDRWSTFMSSLRQFGITNITEGTLATHDDEEFARYVRPYRIVTLENSRLRVHIVLTWAGASPISSTRPAAETCLRRPTPAPSSTRIWVGLKSRPSSIT